MTGHSSYSAPKPDERLKEQAIRDAVRFYRQQDYAAARPAAGFSFFAQWRPFAAGALATLVVIVGLLHVHRVSLPAASQSLTNNERIALLAEMKKVFGNRLEGVVQYKGNIEPVVNASSNAYTDAQPVLITLRQGGREMSIISFSGNTVTVNFGSSEMTLSPIVTSDGRVIVEGKDFLWSQGRMIGHPAAAMDARTLGGTSL